MYIYMYGMSHAAADAGVSLNNNELSGHQITIAVVTLLTIASHMSTCTYTCTACHMLLLMQEFL